jgi:hypothetical protein
VSHRIIEVYLLNEQGEISASFTRMRWEVEAVLSAVVYLFPKPGQAQERAHRPPAP